MTPQELAIKESQRVYALLKTKVAITFSTEARDVRYDSFYPFSASNINKIHKVRMYDLPYENTPEDYLEVLPTKIKEECKRLYSSDEFSNDTTTLCFEILSNSIKNQKEIKRVTRLQSASLKNDHLGLKQIQITLEGQNAPSFQISDIFLPYNTSAGKALHTYLNKITLAFHQEDLNHSILVDVSSHIMNKIASLVNTLTIAKLYKLLSEEETLLIEQNFNLKAISESEGPDKMIGTLAAIEKWDISDFYHFIFQNTHSVTDALETFPIDKLSISEHSLFKPKRPEPIEDVLTKSLRISQTNNHLELYCDMGYLEELNIPTHFIPELTPFYKQKDSRGWVLVSSDCFFEENQPDTALTGAINTFIVQKALSLSSVTEHLYRPPFISIYPLTDSLNISGNISNKNIVPPEILLLNTLFKHIHLRYDCCFNLHYLIKVRLDRLREALDTEPHDYDWNVEEDYDLWVRHLIPSDYDENIVKHALAPLSELFKSTQHIVRIEMKNIFIRIINLK